MWLGPCGPRGTTLVISITLQAISTMSTQGAGIDGGYLSRRW